MNACAINAALIGMELQYKNVHKAKGEPIYPPTEERKPYSIMTAASGKNGDMTTYQHLK